MLGLWAKAAGTWREIINPQVRVAGTYRPIKQGWVRVAGVWRQFYQRATYATAAGGSDNGAGTSTITLNYFAAGTFTTVGLNVGTVESGSWVSPNFLASVDYTISAHVASGTPPSGSALDTDLALNANRAWSLTQVGFGALACTLALTLKYKGTVVATGSATITVFST